MYLYIWWSGDNYNGRDSIETTTSTTHSSGVTNTTKSITTAPATRTLTTNKTTAESTVSTITTMVHVKNETENGNYDYNGTIANIQSSFPESTQKRDSLNTKLSD